MNDFCNFQIISGGVCIDEQHPNRSKFRIEISFVSTVEVNAINKCSSGNTTTNLI